MTVLKFRTTSLVVVLASALALSLSSVANSAELLRLSDSQLDQVTAGYLAINVAADAHAVSAAADTFTNTMTETQVNVGEPQDDGYIYTTGNGRASATAIGQTVQTTVGGGFETNQDIVSVDVNLASVTLAVSPRAAELAAQRVQADQRQQQRITDLRAAQDQQRDARRQRQAERSLTQQQQERREARQLNEDQRIADHRARQDARRLRTLRQREQQRLQRQTRAEELRLARAASQGVQPTTMQHQVLEYTVVTRRAVDVEIQQ